MLKSYLDENGVTQVVFADQVKTTPATISRIIKGDFTPSLELAVRIESATGGAVPARYWVDRQTTQTEDEAA